MPKQKQRAVVRISVQKGNLDDLSGKHTGHKNMLSFLGIHLLVGTNLIGWGVEGGLVIDKNVEENILESRRE